jgi:translation initiation factor 1
MPKNEDYRLVYSSTNDNLCPQCHKVPLKCKCKQPQSIIKNDGVVRIRLETKGRKGKGVTVITGIPLAETELKDYAQQLKKKCGSGGTMKAGIVEIQGDHREALIPLLQQQGWVVKRSGG